MEYAEAVRMDQLKLALTQGASVTDAIYASGFSSSSRVYERAARSMGMTPRRYRERGRGERISYSVVSTSLGELLVASTDKGICSVQLGDDVEALERLLREEFSAAEIDRDDGAHAEWVQGVVAIADGRAPHASLPLDVRGTAFQMQVWRALQKIPRGETRSYADVARAYRTSEAARAVASVRRESDSIGRAVPLGRTERRRARRLSLGHRTQRGSWELNAKADLASATARCRQPAPRGPHPGAS
jgi:AraC family transcriptional regulator of adaptative response/methylated-DNA-[protein]-cysteine methyltransferase